MDHAPPWEPLASVRFIFRLVTDKGRAGVDISIVAAARAFGELQTDPVSLSHGEGMGGVRTGQRRVVSRRVRGCDLAAHRSCGIILDDAEHYGVRRNRIVDIGYERVYGQASHRAGSRGREKCQLGVTRQTNRKITADRNHIPWSLFSLVRDQTGPDETGGDAASGTCSSRGAGGSRGAGRAIRTVRPCATCTSSLRDQMPDCRVGGGIDIRVGRKGDEAGTVARTGCAEYNLPDRVRRTSRPVGNGANRTCRPRASRRSCASCCACATGCP